MKALSPIFRREFLGYFQSPVAYVLIIIFLMSSAACTFLLGNFYRVGQASLEVFFLFHPWLYLFLVPAVGMRLWAEERRSGSIELLFTLPVSTIEAVVGKFLAAWAFLTIALLLTFPIVITAFYLGSPDIGPIISGYFGSALMAGAYLAVASCTSALTKNQVISFVLSVVICLFFVLLGWGVMSEFLNAVFPVGVADAIGQFSFITHFNAMQRGVLDSRDLVYFLSTIGFLLMVNVVLLDSRKSV